MKPRALLLLGLGLLCLGAGFGWGFLTHRQKIFPFELLRRLPFAPLSSRENVRSASPALAALRSLPYVGGVVDPDSHLRGVVEHDPERAAPGVNLYHSEPQNRAQLVDMEGHVLHEWSYPSPGWQHAELLPDGGLLVLIKKRRVFKLDRDSNLLWSFATNAHHDLGLDARGRIYVLSRVARRQPELHPEARFYADTIEVLSPDGSLLETVDLLEIVAGSPYAFLLPSLNDRQFPPSEEGVQPILDPLHANHVEIFDGRLAGRSPLFAAGNLLISMRNINAVAILDGHSREILWLWGPTNLTFQHHPTLLPSGRLLIFDNGLERSRVIELDPLSRRVEWSYAPPAGFFSAARGSSQRLPNGNTLITESDKGYALEVTPDGETVWKFANPDVAEDGTRRPIWRVTRFRRADLPFLAAGGGETGEG